MKFAAVSLLLALMAPSAMAAPAPVPANRYAVVEYMHIPDGKTDEAYVATEKLWQRLHQRAVDAGICLAWILEKVENGGRGDYATVRVYDSLDKLSNPWPESIQKDLFTAEETKTMEHTEETRDLIHRELWHYEASAAQTPGGDPSTYVVVNFMKPREGKTGEYYNMEKDTYLKIQQARVKAGELKNWHFSSRVFPSGTDSQYDFITIDVYPTKEITWNEKIIETTLGKDAAAKLADPNTVRTCVRRELWRPLLRAVPTQK